MKEIIVQRKIVGGYSAVSNLEEAQKIAKNGNYGWTGLMVGDTAITLIFPTFFGSTRELEEKEVDQYLNYVRSITGLEIPEVAD